MKYSTSLRIVIVLFLFSFGGGILMTVFEQTHLALQIGSTVSMWVLVLAALVAYYRSGGVHSILALTALGSILFALEVFGAHGSFIYGVFQYTDLLQPQLVGVPLVMIWVWPLLVASAYGIAQRVFHHRASIIITSVGLLIAFDLLLDPGAVHLGLWQWAVPGPWYGIPLSNYLGWFIMGCIGSAGLSLLARLVDQEKSLSRVPMMDTVWIGSLGLYLAITFIQQYWGAFSIGILLIAYYWFLVIYGSKADVPA